MGIASSCFLSGSPSMVKLVFWGGRVQLFADSMPAGELMFEYPDRIICHADSFYIGHPVPILSLDDKLLTGHTYFVLPVDCLPIAANLTTAALARLSSNRQKPNLAGSAGPFPFEYLKSGADCRMLIKVVPEFIVGVISAEEEGGGEREARGGELCSTPELRKHYAQLVGPRERPWSPKLETITEKKPGLSPARLLGFDQKR